MAQHGGSKQSLHAPFKGSILHLLEVIAGLILQSVTECSANSATSFRKLGALKKCKTCEKWEKDVCCV